MKDIDKYAYASRLRMINPHQKVLFACLILTTCLFIDSISLFVIVILLMGYITVYRGKVSIELYVKLMRIPLGFLIISLLTLAFEFSKETSLFIRYVTIGSMNIGVTQASILTVTLLFFKVFACVSCLYFLCLSTPITDILIVFESMKCPVLLTEMMSLIYRFIFVLIDTAYTIQVAQTSRLGYKGMKASFRSFGMLMSSLLVRTLKINNDLYVALECRGYTGSLKVLNEDVYQSIGYLKIILVEVILLAIALTEKCLF